MTFRRPVFAAVVLLLGVMLASNSALAAPRPNEYILPGDEVFPEGIAFEQSTGYFFVSSTTDGTIFRGHVSEPVADIFLPGNEDGRVIAVGLAVDDMGRLFIAGGPTGMVFVYNSATGDLLAALHATDPADGPTFVNDVVVTRSGDAFFTDSMNPVLYRVFQDASGDYVVEEWLELDGTAIEFQPGFNINGIVVTQNDRYLIVVQSNTGQLFRIEIATRDIVEIDTGGAALTAGDGLVLQGRTLYVVRNALGEIVLMQLTGQLTSGTQTGTITDPSFGFPTTAAMARGRLLVVNSQFDARSAGVPPELPFTVSSVKMRP
jgi:sugar lactone lactonase YvrE